MSVATSTPPPKRGRPPAKPKLDFSLLTPEDKGRIEEEVAAIALDEKRKVAIEAYREQALLEARREHGIEEEMVTFTLDLAEFADRLTIDSRIFFHGREYTVPRSVYDTMRDMAYRTWGHQMEIDGKSKKKIGDHNLQRRFDHGTVNTSQLMRV